jgi:hypothetical protein
MLETLARKGDFCWHCHTGISSFPMQIAVKLEVPLLFWGEPSAEYTSYYSYEEGIEEVDERRFNRFINLGITAEDMVGMLDDEVTMRDLECFAYPKLADLRRVGVRSVCLGSFIPWDVKAHVRAIKEDLGWREDSVEGVPDGYGYEKVECGMQGVRDYIRYLKRGYGRTAHLASIDIRNGRMDRETAAELIAKHDGKRPASLDVFLDHVGISEDEFTDIVSRHTVAPWIQPDPSELPTGEKLWDQDLWDRTSTDEQPTDLFELLEPPRSGADGEVTEVASSAIPLETGLPNPSPPVDGADREGNGAVTRAKRGSTGRARQ